MNKQCSKCGEEKELDELVKNKKCKDGRAGYCKKHANQYGANWRQNNLKRSNVYKKTWKQNNPKQFKLTVKNSYLKRNRQLVDSVIKTYLNQRFGISRDEITSEMIQLKREQIILRRGIHQLKRAVNESN